MRSGTVKRTLALALAAAALVLAAGCADKNYAAQKAAYKYDQAYEKIIASPGQFTRAEFEETIEGYRKLQERFPDWGGLAERRLRIGQLYYAMAEFPEARAALKQVLAKHADDPRVAVRALALTAECYEREGNWEQAELEYRKLVENYGRTDLGAAMTALSRIATHYAGLGDREKADAAYKDALALLDSLREAVTDAGALSLLDRLRADVEVARAALAGELELGLDGLIDVAEKYRGEPAGMDALARLGLIYRRMNDREKALATFDQYLAYADSFDLWNQEALQQTLRQVVFGKAQMLLEEGKVEEAQDLLEEARSKCEVEGFAPASLLFEGRALAEAGHWEEAQPVFARLQEEYSSTREAFQVPALVAFYRERAGEEAAREAWERAKGYYTLVFRQTKDHPRARAVAVNALLTLASIQARLGEPEAVETLEELDRLFPDSTAAYGGWVSVARVYQGVAARARREGREEEAKALLARAVDVYREGARRHPAVPVSAVALFEAAAILSSDDFKDYSTVADLYKTVVEWFPEDPGRGGAALVGVGAAYSAAGRYEEAERAFKEAMEKFSDNPRVAAPAMLGLARVYDKWGRWEDAEAVFAQLRERYPYESAGAVYTLQIPLARYGHWKELDPEKAREVYDAAVAEYRSLAERYPDTLLSFSAELAEAALALAAGDEELALDIHESLYERYRASARIGPTIILRLASFYETTIGDPDKAYEYYREVMDKFPESREAGQAASAIVRMGRALPTGGVTEPEAMVPVGE